MKAIVIDGHGGPEVLLERSVPEPQPGPEEVRVRVRAAALNRADLLQRRGLYPAPAGAPAEIPGLEFAGEVERCGTRVSDWRPGDRVMGIVGGGGYAELLVTHQRLCLPVPDSLEWAEAAAIPEAFLTAFDALFARAALSMGETVLVRAASSGVGTAACQLAVAAGAPVIASSRSPAKHDALRALGAGHVIDPSAPDEASLVRAAAGERGVDVVLELVGGRALERDLAVLAGGGRIVLVGLLGGRRAELDLSRLLASRATLVGTVLRSRPLEEKIALTRRFGRVALPAFSSGRLRPVVDRVLPLERAAEAHRLMETDAHLGKIVLRVAG